MPTERSPSRGTDSPTPLGIKPLYYLKRSRVDAEGRVWRSQIVVSHLGGTHPAGLRSARQLVKDVDASIDRFMSSWLKCGSCLCVLVLKWVFLTDQLERVFLRLGHAETDEQLQDIISKFLPPVLLKLSSVQEGVRKKVSKDVAYLCPKTYQQNTAFISLPKFLTGTILTHQRVWKDVLSLQSHLHYIWNHLLWTFKWCLKGFESSLISQSSGRPLHFQNRWDSDLLLSVREMQMKQPWLDKYNRKKIQS